MEAKQLIGRGRTAEIFMWEPGKVLKLYQDWCPLEWAEDEARYTKAVYDLGLPAPAIYDRVDLNGRHGFIMERLDGHILLEEFKLHPWKVAWAGRLLGELQAAMHERRMPEFRSGRDGLRWAILHADGVDEELKQKVIAYMERALPDGDMLCHGDFHPENVMLTSRGPVILDWAFPSRGNPLADAARTLMILSIGSPIENNWLLSVVIYFIRDVLRRSYVRTYQRLRSVRPGEIEAWLAPIAAGRLRENIPGEREKLIKIIRNTLASIPA